MADQEEPSSQSENLGSGTAGTSKKPSAQKRKTRTQKAGIFFPVAAMHRRLKASTPAERVTTSAAIYLAAVLEYLSAELLEMAGDEAQKANKRRILPKHVFLAFRRDAEYDKLVPDVWMPDCGSSVEKPVDLQLTPWLPGMNLDGKKVKNPNKVGNKENTSKLPTVETKEAKTEKEPMSTKPKPKPPRRVTFYESPRGNLYGFSQEA